MYKRKDRLETLVAEHPGELAWRQIFEGWEDALALLIEAVPPSD